MISPHIHIGALKRLCRWPCKRQMNNLLTTGMTNTYYIWLIHMLLFWIEHFHVHDGTHSLYSISFCCCLNWLHKIFPWNSFRSMCRPAKKKKHFVLFCFSLSSLVWKVMELIESFVFSFITIEIQMQQSTEHIYTNARSISTFSDRNFQLSTIY